MKALAASPLCQDLPDESKEHVAEACESCLRQISIAEADSRWGTGLPVWGAAKMYLEAPLKKMLKQLKQCLEDLSKACSGYKDEALWPGAALSTPEALAQPLAAP